MKKRIIKQLNKLGNKKPIICKFKKQEAASFWQFTSKENRLMKSMHNNIKALNKLTYFLIRKTSRTNYKMSMQIQGKVKTERNRCM